MFRLLYFKLQLTYFKFTLQIPLFEVDNEVSYFNKFSLPRQWISLRTRVKTNATKIDLILIDVAFKAEIKKRNKRVTHDY